MTARLYDKNGRPVDIDNYDDVNEGLVSGKYRAPKGIDQPAISNEDGSLYWIPSNEIGQAIADKTVRYASPADIQAFQDRNKAEQTAAINEKNFGDTGGQIATFGEGFLSAQTGGLSRALLPETAKQAVKTAGEVNPVAETLGEVAGTLTPLGVGGVAANVGKTAERVIADKLVGKGLSYAVPQYSTATKIVSKIGGSAVEGATLGLGQGISEAALGDPDQAAEHIMAGAGWGSLFGGVLGGAGQSLKETAPLLKALGKSVSDITAGTRQAIADKLVYPLLSSSGERTALKAGMDLEQAERLAYMHGGEQGLKDIIKESGSATRLTEKELRQTAKDLNRAMRPAAIETKQTVEAKLAETGGDVFRAQRELVEEAGELQGSFDEVIKGYTNKPDMIGTDLTTRVSRTIKKLESLGDSEAKTAARNINDRFTATMSHPQLSVFDEVSALKSVREYAGDVVFNSKVSKAVKTEINSLRSDLRTMLRNHPEEAIADLAKQADDRYNAADELGRFIKQKRGGPIKGSMAAIMDPQIQGPLDKVVRNAPEFAPIFREFAEALGNQQKELEVAKRAIETVNAFKAAPLSERSNPEALRAVFHAIGAGKDVMGRVDKLAEMKAFADKLGKMNAPDQLIAIKQALGQDVSKELTQASKSWDSFNTLDKVKKSHALDRQEGAGSLIGKGAAATVLHSVGIPYPVTAAAYGLHQMRQDAWRGVRTLTALQQAATTGAKGITKATESAVNTLLSGKIRAAGISQGVKASLEDKRKTFKDHSKILADAQNPEQLADKIADKFAYLDGAPNIKAAMGTHIVNTVSFLQDKLPKNPMAETNPFGGKNSWQPSDSELTTFYRYVEAAQNPASIVDHLAEGRVTKEEVETARTLFPRLYQELQSGIVEALMGKGDKLSYEHRLALGVMFDMSTDASLNPDNLTRLQSNFIAQDKGGRPPTSQKAPQIAGATASGLQQLEQRNI